MRNMYISMELEIFWIGSWAWWKLCQSAGLGSWIRRIFNLIIFERSWYCEFRGCSEGGIDERSVIMDYYLLFLIENWKKTNKKHIQTRNRLLGGMNQRNAALFYPVWSCSLVRPTASTLPPRESAQAWKAGATLQACKCNAQFKSKSEEVAKSLSLLLSLPPSCATFARSFIPSSSILQPHTELPRR